MFYGYKTLPHTPTDEESVMSREDRLAVGEYIIRRAKEANRLKELGKDEMLVSENLADLIKKGKMKLLLMFDYYFVGWLLLCMHVCNK